jgi:hypothetical protein
MKITFAFKLFFLLFAMASSASAQYFDVSRVRRPAAHDEWATQVVFTLDGARVARWA